MYREHTIGAVVPAYNEAGFVGTVIDEIPSFVDRAYVIDDGSSDETWSEINSRAAIRNAGHDGPFDQLIVPIKHDENRGVGGAIKTGYRRAREEGLEVTVVLGGDDQMDPGELTRYIDPIVDGTADYAKGNRFARREDRAAMPRFRLLGNIILSYLTKIASGYWGIMDSQNGYTAISLHALRETDIEGMYEYYGYCNDLLVRLNVANIRVADVPRSSTYAYQEGWKSHIDYKEYIPRVSAMLFRSFHWRLREKYLLERFNPLAILYVLGMGVLGIGLTGMLSALIRRKNTAASWFLSVISGAVLFVVAGSLDQADNEDLQEQIEPETEGIESPAEETRDPATPNPHEETTSNEMPRTAHPDGGLSDEAQADEVTDRAGGEEDA